MKQKKILLIQLKRIGDVLMTTPATKIIRKTYPAAHITFLVEGVAALAYKENPDVDRIWHLGSDKGWKTKLKTLREIYNEKFELVVDFMGSPTTAVITLASRAKMRLGFNFRGRKLAYTHVGTLAPISGYSANDKLHLLEKIGISEKNLPTSFNINAGDREFARNLWKEFKLDKKDLVVTCSPVSRRAYRVWPAAYYAQVCDFLIKEFAAKLLFLWGPGEEYFVNDVIKNMKETPLPLYPIPSITETVGILEKVKFHIGNNNGLRHMAIAVSTPTVGIFGKAAPKTWTPEISETLNLTLAYDPGCKSNCTFPSCQRECLTQVHPQEVISAIQKNLEAILK